MAMMQQVKGIKPLRTSIKASATKPVAVVERAGRAGRSALSGSFVARVAWCSIISEEI
jgi:hypothetical protein